MMRWDGRGASSEGIFQRAIAEHDCDSLVDPIKNPAKAGPLVEHFCLVKLGQFSFCQGSGDQDQDRATPKCRVRELASVPVRRL
jgi:hypothetical protein